jgi:hypothetical protein
MKPASQRTTVYQRKGQLVLATSNRGSGRFSLWIDSGPVTLLNASESPQRVGEALLESLSMSRSGIELPRDLDGSERALLDAAGLKSWSEFIRGTVSCHVEHDATGTHLVPSRREGAGFVPEKDSEVFLASDSSLSQLAEALGEALRRSE